MTSSWQHPKPSMPRKVAYSHTSSRMSYYTPRWPVCFRGAACTHPVGICVDGRWGLTLGPAAQRAEELPTSCLERGLSSFLGRRPCEVGFSPSEARRAPGLWCSLLRGPPPSQLPTPPLRSQEGDLCRLCWKPGVPQFSKSSVPPQTWYWA